MDKRRIAKGLTKETDLRVKKISETEKRTKLLLKGDI